MNEYTDKDREAIESLRARGFCVVAFSPSELETAPAGKVEDRLVELGWEVIDTMMFGRR